MKTPLKYSLTAALALCGAAAALPALAEGMVPETSVVVVDAARGEGSINVRNTSPSPSLLYTTLQHLPEDEEALLVVTPPLARVEPGESQLVRFILQPSAPLRTERLQRVVFEGIAPEDNDGKPKVSFSVRQNLPVVIRPAGLKVDTQPWKRLEWSVQGGQLVASNNSPYVVRLASAVTLLPSGTALDLGRTYVLPGESHKVALPADTPAGQQAVRIAPATTYGYAADAYQAPLQTL